MRISFPGGGIIKKKMRKVLLKKIVKKLFL